MSLYLQFDVHYLSAEHILILLLLNLQLLALIRCFMLNIRRQVSLISLLNLRIWFLLQVDLVLARCFILNAFLVEVTA